MLQLLFSFAQISISTEDMIVICAHLQAPSTSQAMETASPSAPSPSPTAATALVHRKPFNAAAVEHYLSTLTHPETCAMLVQRDSELEQLRAHVKASEAKNKLLQSRNEALVQRVGDLRHQIAQFNFRSGEFGHVSAWEAIH